MYTDAGFTGYDAHHLCNIHIEAMKCLQYAHSRQMEWVQGYDLLAFMFSQSYSHHIFVTMPPPPLPKVPQNGISMMYIIVLNCRLPISHPDKQYQSGTPVNTIVRKDFKIVLQLGTFTVLTNPHQMNRMLLKQ
jgi:hypothetical protein